jgi:hypothetical protein
MGGSLIMSSEPVILPIWYDYSSRKSLLTYWGEKDVTPEGPQSIVSLCKTAGLKQCFGVSTNFHVFLEAWKSCKEAGIQFSFGLEMTLCDDATIHTEESLINEHKVIIFALNSAAYQDLIRLYTACHSKVENRYHMQRFDCKQLTQYWTDNLLLAIPFFDSFIHINTMRYKAAIMPSFPVGPVIFRETNSGLPFASIIDDALDTYNSDGPREEVRVKTIYYEKYADFEAYITDRARRQRANFNKPNLDYMCSPHFCFEDWQALTK